MPAFRTLFSSLLVVLLTSPALRAQDAARPAAEARPHDEALKAWYAGETDTARGLVEQLIQADDGDALAHTILGRILDGEGDDDSDTELDRGLELGGDDLEVVRMQADLYATRFGNYFQTDLDYLAPAARARAEQLYARWATLEPDSATPLQRLAWIKKTARDPRGAIGMLFAAIAKDPMSDAPHGDLWKYLGGDLSYEQLGAFYEALVVSFADEKVRGRCLNYQGQILLNHGQKLKFDAIKEQDKGNEKGRLNKLERAREAFQEAIPLLLRAAECDPDQQQASDWYTTDARLRILELFGEMGDLAAARRSVDEVRDAIEATHEPDEAEFKLRVERLGYALFQAAGGEQGDAEGMALLVEIWTWATGLVPDNADWWNNLGLVARDAGDYEKSYAAYNRCIELAPDNVRYLNDTGVIPVYHLDRELDRAEELFHRAYVLGKEQYPPLEEGEDETQEEEMRSAWGDAMLNLGLVHSMLGEFNEADRWYDELAEFDPEREDLTQYRTSLTINRFEASLEEENYSEAQAYLEGTFAVLRRLDQAARRKDGENSKADGSSHRLLRLYRRALLAAQAKSGDREELTWLLERVTRFLDRDQEKPDDAESAESTTEADAMESDGAEGVDPTAESDQV